MQKKKQTHKQQLEQRLNELEQVATYLLQRNGLARVNVKYAEGVEPLKLAKEGDSGYDLTAREIKCVPFVAENQQNALQSFIQASCYYRIKTGVFLEMPIGVEAQIRNRSSAMKNGYVVQFGTIDSGYRGEVVVLMTANLSPPQIGERVAQLVFQSVLHPSFFVVDMLAISERGEGSEGSSGK